MVQLKKTQILNKSKKFTRKELDLLQTTGITSYFQLSPKLKLKSLTP
jgi:hypothetical protein